VVGVTAESADASPEITTISRMEENIVKDVTCITPALI